MITTTMITLDQEQFIGLILYLISTSITPGPGNIMSATVGANFGLLKSLPQVCGVTAGLLTIVLLGYGLFLPLLIDYPKVSIVIAFAGIIFMLYLSWQLMRAIILGYRRHATMPDIPRLKHNIGFMHSYWVQLGNPKIWAMAITINTIYFKYAPLCWLNFLLFFIIIVAVNFPCILFWAFIGSGPRKILQKNNRMHWFNFYMGILLALTACHMAYETLLNYWQH